MNNSKIKTKNPKLLTSVSSASSVVNMLFLQNKPNFKNDQFAVSDFILRTKDYGLRPASQKNKPNSKPIHKSAQSAKSVFKPLFSSVFSAAKSGFYKTNSTFKGAQIHKSLLPKD